MLEQTHTVHHAGIPTGRLEAHPVASRCVFRTPPAGVPRPALVGVHALGALMRAPGKAVLPLASSVEDVCT
jgi:hypothetical protein